MEFASGISDSVLPAQAGTQLSARLPENRLVSRLRGNDIFGLTGSSLRRFQTAAKLASSLLKLRQIAACTLT